MPIDDERRRFGRAKATQDPKPQTVAAANGELGWKEGVQKSLQRLQETLLLQRAGPTGLRAEEENRIKTNEEAAQRARNERNEKYERLRQAFERMNRWMAEEKAEAAREESKRAQGMRGSSYLCAVRLTDGVDEDGFRLVGEALERYRQQRTDVRELLESEPRHPD